MTGNYGVTPPIGESPIIDSLYGAYMVSITEGLAPEVQTRVKVTPVPQYQVITRDDINVFISRALDSDEVAELTAMGKTRFSLELGASLFDCIVSMGDIATLRFCRIPNFAIPAYLGTQQEIEVRTPSQSPF